mmetsp:Transcript_14318/g.36453  ORF Transcript_14318/g.36453 Transcript_14318/m.36453 type:complete len:158 (-) Transcript_14318:4115-4588(-)
MLRETSNRARCTHELCSFDAHFILSTREMEISHHDMPGGGGGVCCCHSFCQSKEKTKTIVKKSPELERLVTVSYALLFEIGLKSGHDEVLVIGTLEPIGRIKGGKSIVCFLSRRDGVTPKSMDLHETHDKGKNAVGMSRTIVSMSAPMEGVYYQPGI